MSETRCVHRQRVSFDEYGGLLENFAWKIIEKVSSCNSDRLCYNVEDREQKGNVLYSRRRSIRRPSPVSFPYIMGI